MRRQKSDDGPGGANWMDTYGDLVTLLLTFFVLLYAMSTIDASKWRTLAAAFNKDAATQVVDEGKGLGANQDQDDGIDPDGSVSEVTEFSQLYEYLNKYVQDNNLGDTVKLFKGEGYTFITFQNNIFFEGDSSILLPQGQQILDYLAKGIAGIPDEIGEMRFYGHTAQRGSSMPTDPAVIAFDRQLSVDRSTTVLLYIQFKNIIEPIKMVAEGYGLYRPFVPHDGTEETRMKNRRVEIYIMEANAEELSLEEIYDQMKK